MIRITGTNVKIVAIIVSGCIPMEILFSKIKFKNRTYKSKAAVFELFAAFLTGKKEDWGISGGKFALNR